MKIKLKTLKGVTFDVEAEPDTTIGRVKELAAGSEAGKEGGWEAELIKLIHQGKVLENGRDLVSYSIKEEDFIEIKEEDSIEIKEETPLYLSPKPMAN